MGGLAQAVLASLDTGPLDPELLARAGDPEPERSVEALHAAMEHPDLGPHASTWLPALLTSARPGAGARSLVDLASRYSRTGGGRLDLAARPALPRVLGSSAFLSRLLLRHPNWADDLLGDPPAAPGEDGSTEVEPDWTSIRIAKYRGLLRIAGRDLLGRPFEQSPTELSDLADGCLRAGLACAASEVDVPAPALFALGKLGGRELNFSSDVDLLFVYDDTEDPAARHAEVENVVRRLKRNLEVASEDGFAYRVDLDLRPEGRTGTVANSVESALNYYETFGAEWERQMLLRLRHVAGEPEAARQFEAGLAPFVYRRLIDPGAIARVREMKAKIESERRAAGRDLEHDLKEGPGGIRDVEFLVQALQLFHGGSQPGLRDGNVLRILEQLRSLELLPERVTACLSEAYVFLRRAEHSVQLAEEQQTHKMPRDVAGQTALARRMGYADELGSQARERMLETWTDLRSQVRAEFEALVLDTGHA